VECAFTLSFPTYSDTNNLWYINRWQWAACQLDTLGKCLNRSMLQKSLQNLPRTLDETYDRILCAIDDDYYGYALSILQWLAFSARPLQMEEVAEIVAITINGTPIFDKDQVLADPSDVLRICSSLVTSVTRASNDESEEFSDENATHLNENITTPVNQQYLTLAHYSVKEYLVSERIQKSPAAKFSIQERASNRFIAESCLAYILQFQEQDCLNENTLSTYKLARYAAQFWTKHAQAAKQDDKLLYQLVRELFTTTDSAYLNWLRIWDPDSPWEGLQLARTLDEFPTPLYYASLAGLAEMVRLLVNDACVDVNVQGGWYKNALQAASCGGHEKVVEQLLEAGADVDA
jgi:Ankyrin repeats (3 copies)